MKVLLFAIIFLAAGALDTRAFAQNYPWCAYYGTGDGTAVNCGFDTREQCMATVSGIGGGCVGNNQYVAPRDPPADAPPSTGKPDQR